MLHQYTYIFYYSSTSGIIIANPIHNIPVSEYVPSSYQNDKKNYRPDGFASMSGSRNFNWLISEQSDFFYTLNNTTISASADDRLLFRSRIHHFTNMKLLVNYTSLYLLFIMFTSRSILQVFTSQATRKSSEIA